MRAPAAARRDLEVDWMHGETIKDYRITDQIGNGAMGEVWRAEQTLVSDIKVAIKLLLPEWSHDEVIVQRFFDEARAVNQIKHAGIPRIHGAGIHAGRAFLIMELLEGETLGARLRKAGRLPLGLVGEFGKQIANVLKATHAADIIHRDLKPENVFLVPDDEADSGERAKVLDFGIARLGGAVRLTTGGRPMGTPAYMAPELWANAAEAGAAVDVYALGCIAFEMCCGRPPFEVTSYQDACHKHTSVEPPRVRSLAPDAPQALDELIAAALAKRPERRPSVRDLLRAFTQLAAAYPPGAPTTEPDVLRWVARKRSARYRRRLIAITTGTVAGIAVGAYAMSRPRTPGSMPSPRVEPPVAVVALPSPPPPPPPAPSNAWVRIAPPAAPVILGIRTDGAPAAVRGFRPVRGIASPAAPYEIQEHEVTWSEIEPWLSAHHVALAAPPWAAEPAARAALPVTGARWTVARMYCESLGGSLPSEEQWEFAARGAALRPASWGAARLDRDLTRAYGGVAAVPAPVKHSAQDRTPEPAIYDLIGNVQEWTLGLWREDAPGTDEGWVSTGKTSIRAIRGLPLAAEPPAAIQDDPAAYREELCATGKCVDQTLDKLRYIGFRCARQVP